MKRRTMLVKLCVAIIFSLLLGQLVASRAVRDREKGQHLTIEQYTADFEKYKEKLENRSEPMPFRVVSFIFVFGVLAIYEGLGYALGGGKDNKVD